MTDDLILIIAYDEVIALRSCITNAFSNEFGHCHLSVCIYPSFTYADDTFLCHI